MTSEILRVADGQVRCGRCQTQFDALERLIEESDAGEVESGRYLRPPRSPQAKPAIEVEEPITHEDVTLEGRHIEISGTYEVLDAAEGGKPRLMQEVTEEWVEIDDVDEAAPTEDEIDIADEFEAADGEEVEERDSEADEPGQFAPADRFEEDESRTHTAAAPEFEFLAPRRRAIAPVWTWLAFPLVALLAMQALHHYRSVLARHPRIGAPLVSVYDALGLRLTPDWNLHAYEIRQWGVVSDPTTPGTLKVRASITNLADFAQPYPLLKLVLEDRWGDQVRAREFGPADYLDPGAAPDRLLAPAQKTNATIAIVDPGPDAEGFRFDVCLPGKRGTVCAGEVPEGSD
ncbi:MAG: DUF3426 domain-containing protein [Steroidobacter sp.]